MEVKRQGPLGVVMILVGNKCDLDAERQIDSTLAQQYAKDQHMLFIETSAKTNHNIDALFTMIAKVLIGSRVFEELSYTKDDLVIIKAAKVNLMNNLSGSEFDERIKNIMQQIKNKGVCLEIPEDDQIMDPDSETCLAVLSNLVEVSLVNNDMGQFVICRIVENSERLKKCKIALPKESSKI